MKSYIGLYLLPLHNLFILVANKIYNHFRSLVFWWPLKLQSIWNHTVNINFIWLIW